MIRKFEFEEKDLTNIIILIETCLSIGNTKIAYNNQQIFIAEIAVDVKREFDRQIIEQDKTKNVDVVN